MDLAEFVSDYWQIYRENGGPRPTAKEIALAWQEANNLPGYPDKGLIASIRYYMP